MASGEREFLWMLAAHPDVVRCGTCSKNEALRLLRKLVVIGVLSEETFRADNQYGGVMSHLSVCEPVARRLADGALHIRMPFLVC